MSTYRNLLTEGKNLLSACSGEEAEWEAWLLLRSCAALDRSRYLLVENEEVSPETELKYRESLALRASGMPTAYIVGEWEFYGLPFIVNPSVLIPRQDTESLVEEALKLINPGDSVWDLCTGSGCIAVALAIHGPKGISLFASDISEKALAVARENAERNGAAVQFALGDFFVPAIGKRFSLIVTNPPYIEEDEYLTLQKEVVEHEPKTALVAPEKGLYFYRRLAEEGSHYLVPGGFIAAEIGNDQGAALYRLFSDKGWQNVQIKKDLAGNDRVLTAQCRIV